MDVIGDCAATLINDGHAYSEVGNYSLSTLFYLIENLAEKRSGKPKAKRYNQYPIHLRRDHGAAGREIRIQGSGFSHQQEIDTELNDG